MSDFKNIFKVIFIAIIFVVFFMLASKGMAQKVYAYGYVTDIQNNAVPFATIVVRGGQEATISGEDGFFSFSFQSRDTNMLLIRHTSFPATELLLPQGDSVSIDVVLYNSTELRETIIVDKRAEQHKQSSTSNVQLIPASFIGENMRGNLFSSLENLPGVQAAHVGGTMSRPLIRGMGGYRIVLAKNYLKQEEHFWNMHQGGATEQCAVEDVELIKGPASLIYGSDAIGGVLNIITHTTPSSEGLHGGIYITGKSNNGCLGGTTKISARRKNVFAKAVVTYNAYADYNVPADSFEYKPMHFAPLNGSLMNTAGEEYSLNVHAGVIHKNGNSNFIISHYRHKAGFFAFGAGQELINADTAIHSASARDILLPSTDTKNTDFQYITGLFYGRNTFKIVTGFQQYNCSEFDYIEDITGQRLDDYEKFNPTHLDLAYQLNTLSGQVTHVFNDTGRVTITSAVNAQYQNNTINGFNHLLPHYNRFVSGLSSDLRYKLNSNFTWQAGVRIDYGAFSIAESLNPNPSIGDSIFNSKITKDYPSITYATGIMFSNNKLLAKCHLGKSFRMPSAYELASYGIHRHNLRFEKGMPSLNPEEAYQADIVLELSNAKSTVVVSPFINYFTNYIYLTPTPDFALGTFTGQVYEYRQNKAMHSGAEASALFDMPYRMHLLFAAEYVYAVNLDSRLALPYTPPFSLLGEMYYKNDASKTRFGLEAVYVAAQNLVAINECNTPAYTILNIKAQRELRLHKQAVVLYLSIHNLLNVSYLNHLSYYRRLQIPEPGRNIQLTLQWSFNKPNN